MREAVGQLMSKPGGRAGALRAMVLGAVVALGAVAAGGAAAEPLPLWEVGAGGTGLILPDYRGSDQSRGYVYPIPYVIYRGDRFRIDKDRIREFLLSNDRLELELSVNANVPVDSNRNNARRGMPNLRAVIEGGPSLRYLVYKAADGGREFFIRLPARGAMSTDGRFIGWVFQPGAGVDWSDVNVAGSPGWNFGVQGSWTANTRHYDNFYYSVDPAYATPARAAYSAPGGGAGAQVTLAASKRFPSFWVGGFLRYDSVRGAQFAQSPLVRTQQDVYGGVAVAWVFGRSDETVDATR